MQESDDTEDSLSFKPPIASRIVEGILAEKRIEARIAANESDIEEILEKGITPEMMEGLDISKADVIIPGTSEMFDLDNLLDLHDIAITELKAANFVNEGWVTDYIVGLELLKLVDFNEHLLAAEFSIESHAPQPLKEWLTFRSGKTIPTPFGLVPIRGPEEEPGVPVREGIRINMENTDSLDSRTGVIEDDISSHRARLDAVEADIDGIIAGLPVVETVEAEEILTSILPLGMTLDTETKAFRTWMENYHALTANNKAVGEFLESEINRNYDQIVGNRNHLDRELDERDRSIDDNKQLIDTLMALVDSHRPVISDAHSYMHPNAHKKRLQGTVVGIGDQHGNATIPYWLGTTWTNPVTGEVRKPSVRFRSGKNAEDLVRFKADTTTQLAVMESDIDDIRGMSPVLGASDYEEILEKLKNKMWFIGDTGRMFQSWQELFNSRTVGNETKINEQEVQVGENKTLIDGLDGEVVDNRSLIDGLDAQLSDTRTEFDTKLGEGLGENRTLIDGLDGRLGDIATEFDTKLGDGLGVLDGRLGIYDNGFKGDNEFRNLIKSFKDQMANMQGSFQGAANDIAHFSSERQLLLERADEEFLLPMSADTRLDITMVAFNALLMGGKMRYNDKGIDVEGDYEFVGLMSAFGLSSGSTSEMSQSAGNFGGYGGDSLEWSPI